MDRVPSLYRKTQVYGDAIPSETVFKPGGKFFDPSIKPLFQEAEGVIPRAMPGEDV